MSTFSPLKLSLTQSEATSNVLNLEERRLRNIARNQEFLRELFSQQVVNSEKPMEMTLDSIACPETNEEENERIKADMTQRLLDAKSEYLFRETQIDSLKSFLSLDAKWHLDELSMLIVYGPPDTGKSSIVQAVLSTQPSIHPVTADCNLYHSVKEMIRTLQFNTHMSLSNIAVGQKRFQNRLDKNRVAESIQDFASYLNKAVDINTQMCFFIDSFDKLADYKAEMANFSNLRKMSNRNIIVICAIRSPPFKVYSTLVAFPDYDESQIQILLSRNLKQLITNRESQTSVIGEESINATAYQAIEIAWNKLYSTAIHIILGVHRRITRISAVLLSTWTILYSNPVVNSYQELVGALKSSKSVSLGNYFPDIPVSAVRNVVQEILSRPLLTIRKGDKAFEEIKSKFLKAPSVSSSAPKATITNGERRKAAAENYPRTTRYLIIASFLASCNSKSEDNLKFLGEKAGKKRARDSLESSNSTAKGPDNQSETAYNIPPEELFSIERLYSIYAQVANFCTNDQYGGRGRVVIEYGSLSLSSALQLLVENQLLLLPPSWRMQKPTYASNITKSLAMEMANSVGFPLSDFISKSYRISI